jgi:hypothetical protein
MRALHRIRHHPLLIQILKMTLRSAANPSLGKRDESPIAAPSGNFSQS